ncbi:MAG: hypothetical protein ACREMA_21090, partial [Longimicrobiales bacterium]
MRSLGAVVVGIGAYRGTASGLPKTPLKYPSRDAAAFATYLHASWPDTSSATIDLVREEEATAARIAAAV